MDHRTYKNIKSLTEEELFQEHRSLVRKGIKAHERVHREGNQVADRDLMFRDWKAFSRQRGYTEEEISDYERYIEIVKEGLRRGIHEDDLAVIDAEEQGIFS
jgi:hypothetical protein